MFEISIIHPSSLLLCTSSVGCEAAEAKRGCSPRFEQKLHPTFILTTSHSAHRTASTCYQQSENNTRESCKTYGPVSGCPSRCGSRRTHPDDDGSQQSLRAHEALCSSAVHFTDVAQSQSAAADYAPGCRDEG